tara:strand:- start:1142 stop:2662 length:1521 start_codon:yes stop_codon:yes gene_type:complete
MIDLSDPTLNRKKKQKLIKELYGEINAEVGKLTDVLKESSPISLYWKTPQKKADKIILESIKSKETRRKRISKVIVDAPYKYETTYQEQMLTLIKSERAEVYGIPNASDKKFDSLDFIETLLTCVNIEARIKWLEYVIEKNIFNADTLLRLKLFLYTASDDLNTDRGRVLTELCIDNNYQSISDVLDEELVRCAENDDDNIKQHIMTGELNELRKKLDAGDPFYVYRGFLVNEDEYVRLGKKSEGDAYWKQNAGIGISYSLDRNIAGYFCFWSYCNSKDGVDIGRKRRWSDYIPPYIINKEEWVEDYAPYVSSLRDKDNRKPIICKFLIDPKKIKGFSMSSSEAEVMITPDDTIVESYTIATSKDIATCVMNWRVKQLDDWEDIENIMFNDEGVAIMPIIKEDGSRQFIFADGKKINEKIKTIKEAIKKSGETPAGLRWEMIMEEYFKEYSYELPRDEFEINPLVATKNIFNLLTNKHNVNLKSRRGKVYNWSGQAVKALKDLVKK